MPRSRRSASTLVDEPPAPVPVQRAKPLARWLGRPLVVCVDGPLAGRWYFSAWWDGQLQACEHLAAKGCRPGVWVEYERTARRLPHPDQPTDGLVLHWRGARRPR